MSSWHAFLRVLRDRAAEKEASRRKSFAVESGPLRSLTEHPILQACQKHLDRFFHAYPEPATQKSATKVLLFLAATDTPLTGKPEGWAAGIIYALAKRGRRPCGVPGFLNAEFEQFFGVSMGTVRKRAARVERAIEI